MTWLRRLRQRVLDHARTIAFARKASAKFRKASYEQQVSRFIAERTGRANRLPSGIVYEATMRCNLHCEFCYVGNLLNIEGEWREELPLEVLRRAFPESDGLTVSLTGGEIFMRKDILAVMDVFREKGYACGYLTTNGTIIDEHRAEALARLARDGFLKHISISIDGPEALHDRARGQVGTFERTSAGLRRLQAASKRLGAPLRVSINTTVAQESLATLDQMVEVADELGVDAIGLNHLMFTTPDEVDETLRLIGETDRNLISTFVTPHPGITPDQVRRQVAALEAKCRAKGVLFDFRPKVYPQLIDSYYTPGAHLGGRCLYPFLHARVSFSGKVYFCPFIRVQVGDLAHQTLEEIWNSDRYVDLRSRLLNEGLFPVCRRCCKVELSAEPAMQPQPVVTHLDHRIPVAAAAEP